MNKSERISEKLYELMRDEDAMPKDVYEVMPEVWQSLSNERESTGEYQIKQQQKKSQQ